MPATFLKVVFLLVLSSLSIAARAQYEFNAWRFGENAGLQFPAIPANGPPAPTSSPMFSIEGCASMADSAGNLQCYTNAEQVWNRLGRVMPNGQLGSGNGSNAAQGALLLQHPGQRRQYFLFTVDAALTFTGGLRYSIVDMRLDVGNGDVLAPGPVLLPLPTPNYVITESLTGVRHANGTDYWVVVHGWQTDEFLAYRVLPTGVDPVPVSSHIGRQHGPSGPPVTPFARGSVRASPDGRRLAASVESQGVEIFDFDNLTGRISNARSFPLPLAGSFVGYGIEFSADSNVLYTTDGVGVYQLDLRTLAGLMPLGSDKFYFLQRGPDNRIYVANYQARSLGVITAPNVVGPGCGFLPTSQVLGRRSMHGLPNFPNQPARPTRIVAPRSGCLGTPTVFTAEGFLVTGTGQQWDFGDPASGPANQATGNPVSHSYTRAGTYTVSLTLNTSIGVVRRVQVIQVVAPPTLRLMPRDTVLCEGTALTLQANPQPAGTTYRWQDGSTAATLLVEQAGRYVLEVRNAAGCSVRDSVLITTRPCPLTLPNIITPNGDHQNQAFVLKGLNAPGWSVAIYNRWGKEIYRQEQYDNTWAADGQADGIYYYLLRNIKTGLKIKGWLEVRR